MADLIIEIIGWFGMALVLVAYLLITTKKVKIGSFIYHGLNFIGAITLGFNALANEAYPSALLNAIWLVIAVYGLLEGMKIFKR
ncbi:MAG: hypothetical protein ABIE55_00395 [Candidatus Aenigmatarchaeota archaeon]